MKCFLHISTEEQRKRLLARLDNPTSAGSTSPATSTNMPAGTTTSSPTRTCCAGATPSAPWYVVPADRKWYRNWAVSRILVEQLRTMGLVWPTPSGWNPETERARLRELLV